MSLCSYPVPCAQTLALIGLDNVMLDGRRPGKSAWVERRYFLLAAILASVAALRSSPTRLKAGRSASIFR